MAMATSPSRQPPSPRNNNPIITTMVLAWMIPLVSMSVIYNAFMGTRTVILYSGNGPKVLSSSSTTTTTTTIGGGIDIVIGGIRFGNHSDSDSSNDSIDLDQPIFHVDPSRLKVNDTDATIVGSNITTRIESVTTVPTTAFEFLGLQPRSWDPWPLNRTLCFDPGPNLKFDGTASRIGGGGGGGRNSDGGGGSSPFPLASKAFDEKWSFKQGLVFVKPMKVGGSSATGINLRMAKNMAARNNETFPICSNNFDHAMGWMFQKRNPNQSFLWTMLRDPTQRAVSGFWHFRVSREHQEPNMDNFLKEMTANRHFYLKMHTLQRFVSEEQGGNMLDMANAIMEGYDFMAITERFDESMVVLQMLLGVPLGDFLYVKAKTNGGYDDGGNGGRCTYIQPSNLTVEMQRYLDGDEWKASVRWDHALWQAAKRSLDLTIDRLGRSTFERKLELYRQMQTIVNKRCIPEAKVPCPGEGWKRKPSETNCLFQDSGCAWQCIDQIVEERTGMGNQRLDQL